MMPPIRDIDFDDEDDDDGMPALVDNPNPSMTFTFFTDMTPITFSSTRPDTPALSSPPASPLSHTDPPTTPPAVMRVSHGKKRDASYIPRPPNAFILFRSSFIKSQQVPGKVEGNHSTLSKIIGMYWKTLPPEEREQWEAKAVIAQAEHRKRYPDWRFRPGANAIAKLKVKDGTLKKRHAHSRKSKEDAKELEKNKDKRCVKIANLLVQGKKGPALEAAVKEWEGRGLETTDSEEDPPPHHGLIPIADTHPTDPTDDPTKTRSKTPDAQSDARFKVALTSMFRRSLSAPASQTRSPFPAVEILSAAGGIPSAPPRDAVSTIPIITLDTQQLHRLYDHHHHHHQQKHHHHEAATSPDSNSLTCLTSACPQGCSPRCSDPFAHQVLQDAAFSPFSPTSGLDPDATSPVSPTTTLDGLYLSPTSSSPTSLVDPQDCTRGKVETGSNANANVNLGMTTAAAAYGGVYKYHPYSTYSTLQGWDREEQTTLRNASASASSSSGMSYGLESSFTLAAGGHWNATADGAALGASTATAFGSTLAWFGVGEDETTTTTTTTHTHTPAGAGAGSVAAHPFAGTPTDGKVSSHGNAFFPTNVI